jgi:hypothetical protein
MESSFWVSFVEVIPAKIISVSRNMAQTRKQVKHWLQKLRARMKSKMIL